MSAQFFILIDKIDSVKFRKFRTPQFNVETKIILEKNNSKFVWGLHKGIVSKTVWDKIRKNDKIFLTIPQENFKICGIVSKKTKNSDFGKLFYPGDLSSKQINNFIFFEKLEECSISYHEIINNSESRIYVERGIHKIKKQFYSEKTNKVKPKKFDLEEKKRGAPKRSRSEIWRFVRNAGKVKDLKCLYHDKCQICGERIDLGSNKFYSEVHHYNPLKKQSDDDYENMIVVCPNHHVKFDYNVIAISRDGTSIINKRGESTGEKIKFHGKHKLDKKNIESQLGD